MDEKLGGLPNAFYDIIVFTSATLLLAVGVFVGCGFLGNTWFSKLGAFDVVLVFGGLLFLGYEYGRLAEAWSAPIVQWPLSILSKHLRVLRNPDFLAELPEVEEALGLPNVPGARKGGKWTVYFYAMLVNRQLGADLLKRYAWEKLSRSSAFTLCVLTVASFSCYGLRRAGVQLPFSGTMTFGTIEYNVVFGVLAVVTYYEYYRRNCWNVDLLKKVLPVLRKAEEMRSKGGEKPE